MSFKKIFSTILFIIIFSIFGIKYSYASEELNKPTSEQVLFVLLQLPTCYKEEQDLNQLGLISDAISTVSNNKENVAALITIGTFESSWCFSVGSGRRKGGSGIGYWQIEPGSNRIKPFAGITIEDTTHAAGEALWLWRHSHQCGNSINSRFIAYAGVKKCSNKWSGAAKRTKFYNWALWELKKNN